MDVDLITLELKLAFEKPGCPICRLRHTAGQRYLRSLLWENVNDGGTRVHLVRALGFCYAHAWQLQQMEKSMWHDGLGTGIIYEDLATRALAGLKAYMRTQDRAMARRRRWRRWRKWIATALCRWFSQPASLTSDPPLPPGLIPRDRCRVCELEENSEETHVAWLVKGCAEPRFQRWYQASDGLCLPHLRRALALAEREDPAVALFLARTCQEKLARLTMQLREYIRKHAWEYRDEPKLPEEQSSWVRTVAFFAGERRETRGEMQEPFGNESWAKEVIET